MQDPSGACNPGSASSSEPTTTEPTTPAPATIGGTVPLRGTTNQMDATMTKVISPLPTTQFDTPGNGKHYVGIQFTLKNTGTNVYSDSPSNGAKLILSDDSQVDTTYTTSDTGCEAAGSMTIAVGATRRGCLAFEVPNGLHPKTIQFTLDSGFADQTGEWAIP